MTSEVDAYIAALPPDQRDALTTLRARLRSLLPGHIEVMSYAMPGFRQPGPKGKVVVGYAAFARHLGLYPHSGSVIPKIDCTPPARLPRTLRERTVIPRTRPTWRTIR